MSHINDVILRWWENFERELITLLEENIVTEKTTVGELQVIIQQEKENRRE